MQAPSSGLTADPAFDRGSANPCVLLPKISIVSSCISAETLCQLSVVFSINMKLAAAVVKFHKPYTQFATEQKKEGGKDTSSHDIGHEVELREGESIGTFVFSVSASKTQQR